MKKWLVILTLCGLPLTTYAQGMQSVPLFEELRKEGVKIVWRGKTACCDSWVLTAPNDEVMWLLTQKNMAEVKYLNTENRPMTPAEIRQELKLDKK